MNTRKPIQPSTDPAVLSLSFSSSRNRFITSLSDGARVFRTDNCLTTCQPALLDPNSPNAGVSVAEVLDDRYIATVPRSSTAAGTGNTIIFYDCVLAREVSKFDLHEPILGVRLSRRWMVVILLERSVVFAYQELLPRQQPTPPPYHDSDSETETETETALRETLRGPNKIQALYRTAPNQYALASLRDDLLILPAQSTGQVQLINLRGGNKRVLKAHNTALRQLSLSPDGALLATASEQGTLLRIFDTTSTDQVAEFRRGVEKAIIFGLAFSPTNRWLASTSDKGTLHIFDLRPQSAAPTPPTPKSDKTSAAPRKTPSYATHRLSTGTTAPESLSAFSARSSSTKSNPSAALPPHPNPTTAYQGSVQEYYGLRPVPASASPSSNSRAETTASAVSSALKASPWAPKVLRDVRSVASAPFWLGDEGPRWQGGTAHSWTIAPGGTRTRVRVPVPPLANDPAGKPPKGSVGFAAGEGEDAGGAVLFVVGGGAEGRWEKFELVPVVPPPGGGGTGWALVKLGFRRFLSRQFVD